MNELKDQNGTERIDNGCRTGSSAIDAVTDNSLTLINNIHDSSKIEAGRIETKFTHCSLATLIAAVDSQFRIKATEKNLNFKVEYVGKIPTQIKTDPSWLRQCLTNLVDNAIRFTDCGCVYIRIAMQETDDKPFIRFDVADTGFGISHDKLEHIFESSSRINANTEHHSKTTDMGLVATKKLARILGGHITAISDLGKGSTFSIAIPVGVDIESVPVFCRFEQEQYIKRYTQAATNRKYIGKVLVAEDIRTNQLLIKAILKKAGLDPIIVENGKLALEAGLAQHFDIILMDMQMPIMSGYEATTTLRNNGINIPIVALTANVMKDDAEKCIMAGCSDYVPKPVNRERIYDLFDRYLIPVLSDDENNTINEPTADQPTTDQLAHATT